MRITVLVPGRGLVGGIKVMGEYAGRLRARGHDLAIRYRRPEGVVDRLAQWWSVRRVPDALDESGCTPVPIDAFTPDVVPDADVLLATGLSTVRAAGALGPKKGLLVHLVQTLVPLERDPDEARAVLGLSAHRVAVSEYVAGRLASHFGADATVVPNGVDHSRFYPNGRRQRQPPTIGLMHAEDPVKGTAEAFEAIRRVRDTWPDARLVVFGPSKPRRTPPRTDVFVRPKTSRLRSIYAGCDVWLAPGHNEGFGLPVLEAMACRTVPVATGAGGHNALIEDEVSGFLVPVGDAEAMAKRIGLLIDDESLYRKMADAAHDRSLLFDWQESTDRLEALLTEWEEQRA